MTEEDGETSTTSQTSTIRGGVKNVECVEYVEREEWPTIAAEDVLKRRCGCVKVDEDEESRRRPLKEKSKKLEIGVRLYLIYTPARRGC